MNEETLDLSNVAPLMLPWTSDPWGRLRPPVSVEAMHLSAMLAEATYQMAVNPWMQAGWRDVTIQVDGELSDGFRRDPQRKFAIGQLASAWKLHRVRKRIHQRNPIGQVMGALRQRERSSTGKVLVMLHPAQHGRYVVAISFMGTGGRIYDWFSNFRMNTESGFHKGFLQLARQFESNEGEIDFPDTAKELGLERLTLASILEEAKSPNSRFILWLSGHSQGGALVQVYAYHKIHEDGVLPVNLVGYGFASPSVMTVNAMKDPAAYPLYHVLNSDDVVPHMGSQVHLGVCLIYPAGEELRKRCYSWPRDEQSIHRRMLVRPVVRRMTDTAACLEVTYAYLVELSSRSPEDIMEGLNMLESRLPIKRMVDAADSRLDDFLRFICRHLAAAYQSITGDLMDAARVAEHRMEISHVINALGVKAFAETLAQLMGQPHHMSFIHDGYMGAYPFIAQYGVEELIPAIWHCGHPPKLVRATEKMPPVPQAEQPSLFNRRLDVPQRRVHKHPRYDTPRQRNDTRHHLPVLRPDTMRPGEKIVRPRR